MLKILESTNRKIKKRSKKHNGSKKSAQNYSQRKYISEGMNELKELEVQESVLFLLSQ